MDTTTTPVAIAASRAVRTRTIFVETKAQKIGTGETVRDYNVEERLGKTTRTIGRVYGAGHDWIALGIGMDGWTSHYPTRAAAVQAMRERRTFTDDRRREIEARIGYAVSWG